MVHQTGGPGYGYKSLQQRKNTPPEEMIARPVGRSQPASARIQGALTSRSCEPLADARRQAEFQDFPVWLPQVIYGSDSGKLINPVP